MHPDEGGRDVKKARERLKSVLEAVRAKDPSKVEVGPKDAASIAAALWELRALGKEALAKNDPAVPKPILAAMLSPKGELSGLLDANFEHAIFLVGLTTAKVHPKVGVPVPPEILLYEAWSTDPDALPLASPKPLVRAVKAYTYGTSELCDLAARETEALPLVDEAFDAKTVASDAKALVGEPPSLPASAAKQLGAAVSVLANGATALCYVQRSEIEKALPHVRKTLAAAEAVGVENGETDLLRGWIECESGDPEVGEKHLAKIANDPDAPARRKDAAAPIAKTCGKGTVAKLLDRATLATSVGLIALDHLERAGLVDALAETDVARFVSGLARGLGGSLQQAKSEPPSGSWLHAAKKSIQGLFSN